MIGASSQPSLGLPEESLDESTQVGIDMVQELQRRPERMAS